MLILVDGSVLVFRPMGWSGARFATLALCIGFGCVTEGQVLRAIASDVDETDGSASGKQNTPSRDNDGDDDANEGLATGGDESTTVLPDTGTTTGTPTTGITSTTGTTGTTTTTATTGTTSVATTLPLEGGYDGGGESSGGAECFTAVGGSASLIDDLDDADNAVIGQDGRRGWWYTFNDGTVGEQLPAGEWQPTDVDALNGQYSARTHGWGFNSWGAALGLSLNDGCPYDASAFDGIQFWARGEGTIRVRFTTVATAPADTGTCLEECWDDYGAYIDLSSQWQRYRITWDELAQEGWGNPADDYDPSTLMHLIWHDADPTTSLDIWVDDIRFYPER